MGTWILIESLFSSTRTYAGCAAGSSCPMGPTRRPPRTRARAKVGRQQSVPHPLGQLVLISTAACERTSMFREAIKICYDEALKFRALLSGRKYKKAAGLKV